MLAFLLERFPDVSAETWQRRMASDEVRDANGRCLHADTPYAGGLHIYYYREIDNEPHVPFQQRILFQDEHLLVADKPHFLPVAPSGRFLHETLLVRLRRDTGLEDLAPIHRIDRETAGIVLFAKNPETRGRYASLFQKRLVSKVYEALAPTLKSPALPLSYRSRLIEDELFFRTQEVAGVANSETHIALLETRGEISRYELRPVSGKKHQLRVHLASLGIPILNDALYPSVRYGADEISEDYSQPLQLLAKSIAFTDPVTGDERHFSSQFQL